VWLGGPLTFWIGRLVVWCEFALIAFCWVELTAMLTGRKLLRHERYLLGVAAFVLTSHTFPPMPWHTIDAVALASCGAWLVGTRGGIASMPGFFLIGCAALCRQNFLPLIPVAVVCLRHSRSVRAWLAAVAPLLLYGVALAAWGALRDARMQLFSQIDVLRWGILPVVGSAFLWVGVALGISLSMLLESDQGPSSTSARHTAGLATLAAAVGVAGSTMTRPGSFFIDHAAFFVLGLCLGVLANLARAGVDRDGRPRLLVLAIGTAWTASISVGYCTPALGLAPLCAAVMGGALRPFRMTEALGKRSATPGAVLLLLVAALLAAWIPARLERVYSDRPARELTHRLDHVLPGAALIRTNANTYDFFEDLQSAVQSTGGLPCAVIPDCAAYWVRSPQPNPLPIDWAQSTELNRPELLLRVAAVLSDGREGRRILVQKVRAHTLPDAFTPLANGDRTAPLVGFVRSRFHKVGETRWFEIYE
jgi:hypothetical protein